MLSRDNASHFYGLSTTTCIMQHEKTLKFLDRAAFAVCVCVALGGNISFEALSVCMNESLIKWAILVPREINLTRLKSAPNTAHALVRLEAMREKKKKKLAGNYVVKMAEGKKIETFKIGSSANELWPRNRRYCRHRIENAKQAGDLWNATGTNFHLYDCARIFQYYLEIVREMASGFYRNWIWIVCVNLLITAFCNLITTEEPMMLISRYALLPIPFLFSGRSGDGVCQAMHNVRQCCISHEFQLSQCAGIIYVNWKPTKTYQSLIFVLQRVCLLERKVSSV